MNEVNNGIPLINGILCSWADIKVTIAGVLLTGITAIDYEDKQVVENVYGAGRHPVGRGYGRITPSGKLTLLREEVIPLQLKAPKGRLQDLPQFDIIVSYIPMGGSAIITDKIRNCSFQNNPRKFKQGDTSMSVDLDLLPSHIDWHEA